MSLQVWDHVVKGERMKIFHNFDKDSEASAFVVDPCSLVKSGFAMCHAKAGVFLY